MFKADFEGTGQASGSTLREQDTLRLYGWPGMGRRGTLGTIQI